MFNKIKNKIKTPVKSRGVEAMPSEQLLTAIEIPIQLVQRLQKVKANVMAFKNP